MGEWKVLFLLFFSIADTSIAEDVNG
jgi:hypothetical protein